MKKIVGPIFGLESGLINEYFNFAIYLENIQLVINYILTEFYFKIAQKKYITKILNLVPTKLNLKKIINSERMLFVLFVLSFIILAAPSFGLTNWILSPRTGYQLYRTGNGMSYAFTKLFLSTFIGLSFLFSKNIKGLVKKFIIILPFAYLLGSKGFLLDIGIYFFIVVWFLQYKKQKLLYGLFLPLVFIAMIVVFKPSNITEIVTYFDYYINTTNYYEAYWTGKLDLFNGKLFITNFWGLVPRNFYPDKPIIYGCLYINEFFFPGGAEATNTPAFAGPIGPFADFGILGVILASIFNVNLLFQLGAYSIIFCNRNYKEIISNPLCVFLILLFFAPQFLDFYVFPLNIVFYLLICAVICISSRLKLNHSHETSCRHPNGNI